MMESLDPTNMSPPAGNGTAAEISPLPSVEALLFNAGAITADQLGELVRDAVLTQRSVATIALERGLATPEMLAGLHAGVAVDDSLPVPTGASEAISGIVVGTDAAGVAPAPQPASPEPALPHVAIETAPVAAPSQPAPMESVALRIEPEPVLVHLEAEAAPAPPEPLRSLDERVQAAVARAAEVAAAAPAAAVAAASGAFRVHLHLRSGERLPAGTAPTFEMAAEIARSLAAQIADAAEWPLIAGRCIRPDAVVSVDIERALEG